MEQKLSEHAVSFGEWIHPGKSLTYKNFVREFVLRTGRTPSVQDLYDFWIAKQPN